MSTSEDVGSPAPTPGLRERKKRATREALTQATLRLAAARGLENVTVDEISAAANVSARTFFNYFSTKEDAIADVGLDGAQRVSECIRTAPKELSALAAVRLASIQEAAIFEENAEALALKMAIAERSPALWPRILAGTDRAMREVATAIGERTGADAGDYYPALLAAVSEAAFRQALLTWHCSPRTRPMSELVDEMFELVAQGLPDPR